MPKNAEICYIFYLVIEYAVTMYFLHMKYSARIQNDNRKNAEMKECRNVTILWYDALKHKHYLRKLIMKYKTI
jgi:hypothetical protein